MYVTVTNMHVSILSHVSKIRYTAKLGSLANKSVIIDEPTQQLWLKAAVKNKMRKEPGEGVQRHSVQIAIF